MPLEEELQRVRVVGVGIRSAGALGQLGERGLIQPRQGGACLRWLPETECGNREPGRSDGRDHLIRRVLAAVVHPIGQHQDGLAPAFGIEHPDRLLQRVVHRRVVQSLEPVDRRQQRLVVGGDRLHPTRLSGKGDDTRAVAGAHLVDVGNGGCLGRVELAGAPHAARNVHDQQGGQRITCAQPANFKRLHRHAIFLQLDIGRADGHGFSERVDRRDVDRDLREA